MILDEATYEAFGYCASKVTYGSNKSIIATCERCGKIRVLQRVAYHTFCNSCSIILGEKRKGRKTSNATKRLQSIARSGKNNPMFGRTGDKCPAWQGGISFGRYCIKFNEKYKRKIRERFGNECFLCSLSEVDNKRKLDVHHVNYNKDCGCDGEKCICVPLCGKCHSKTNSNRDFWTCLITEMLKPFEAWM